MSKHDIGGAAACAQNIQKLAMSRRSFMLSSVSALVGAGILASSRADAQEAASDATLKIGMARDIGSFDPAVAVTSTVIAANLLIFERLYETSYSDRQTRAQLAIGDPEQLGETLYRVKFRTGSVFHNGEPVTAEDVAFSINRIVDAKNGSFYRQFVPFIKTAKPIADNAVEIELLYATDLLKDRLAVVGIAPRSLVQRDLEEFGAKPIGSGPYRMVAASANDQVVLERFDGYKGSTPGLVKKVQLKIITDAAARIAALDVGEVSIVEEPGDLDLDALRSNPEIKVELQPGFLASFVMFNCSKPPFDDKRVRQALMYAIDKDELINVALFGNGKPAKSLLPQHHPLYREPETQYGYNPDKARELLAEAGYADGLKIDGRAFICQTYLTPWNESAANLIVSKWREMGFDVQQNVGGEAIYSNVVNANYDVLIAITDQSWFGWDGSLLYEWFHGAFWSAQLNHFKGEQAQRMQELLQKSMLGDVDRAALLSEVQAIILEETPMSLLFHRDVPTAWRPADIHGVVPLQTASLDVRTISVNRG
ncbi:hypothetical protein ASD00_27320 [Ensifer sp. Root31]|uniref:ABC transporter substrate-binding protein n=1 Tax=Ensifer sp. Root31 TaxID=1736512 RepID=UPI00070D596D|nr:ABC transporter substrate-binding protein [Ensifer sp. Root31]KQU89551.1 hypothetical protein ASD00_27320 [Ensifer sp. Root31]